MALRVQCRGNLPNTLCALAIGGAFLTVAGCSSHEPKPMAQPTPDQVRGHADHTFDKLKQEERERASQEPRLGRTTMGYFPGLARKWTSGLSNGSSHTS